MGRNSSPEGGTRSIQAGTIDEIDANQLMIDHQSMSGKFVGKSIQSVLVFIDILFHLGDNYVRVTHSLAFLFWIAQSLRSIVPFFQFRAQDVLKVFRRNKRIQVKPHNAILDSPTMQTLIR